MTESIFRKDFHPPQTLSAPNFHIFPTNNDFYESDYIAVMNNASMLHVWSQSTWPEVDFTALQNKEDLTHHIEDNINHTAYGYMIYSHDNKKCYGSVYVNPIHPVAENYHVSNDEKNLILRTHARIDYWVIENGLDEKDENIEIEITKALRSWFKNEWKIETLFSARKESHKRLEVYKELGYPCKMNVRSNSSDMTLLLF